MTTPEPPRATATGRRRRRFSNRRSQLAPDWAPAWFALGEARERLGDLTRAVEAFSATLAADPGDAQGARGRLALLG